jgi:hypothetical protein
LEETLPKPAPGGGAVVQHQRVLLEYDAIDRLVLTTDALGRGRFAYVRREPLGR